MYKINNISVYIFNWKKVTNNSLKLYDKIKPILNDISIINCDETQKIDGSIQLDDSHYYGSQYNTAIKHVKSGNILCVIVGDNIPDNNFERIFTSALNTFNSYNVGVYAPHDKRSYHQTTLEKYTNNLFKVENTDCGFWFINPLIVSTLKNIDYTVSKYGWGIDSLTINYAKKHRFLVLRDYSISTDQLDHTCGYDESNAVIGMKYLTEQFNSIK
jgi:hypothetical protein